MNKQKKAADCAISDKFETDGAFDAARDHNSAAIDATQISDWSAWFDALDAFEPGFRLKRDQPKW